MSTSYLYKHWLLHSYKLVDLHLTSTLHRLLQIYLWLYDSYLQFDPLDYYKFYTLQPVN